MPAFRWRSPVFCNQSRRPFTTSSCFRFFLFVFFSDMLQYHKQLLNVAFYQPLNCVTCQPFPPQWPPSPAHASQAPPAPQARAPQVQLAVHWWIEALVDIGNSVGSPQVQWRCDRSLAWKNDGKKTTNREPKWAKLYWGKFQDLGQECWRRKKKANPRFSNVWKWWLAGQAVLRFQH